MFGQTWPNVWPNMVTSENLNFHNLTEVLKNLSLTLFFSIIKVTIASVWPCITYEALLKYLKYHNTTILAFNWLVWASERNITHKSDLLEHNNPKTPKPLWLSYRWLYYLNDLTLRVKSIEGVATAQPPYSVLDLSLWLNEKSHSLRKWGSSTRRHLGGTIHDVRKVR